MTSIKFPLAIGALLLLAVTSPSLHAGTELITNGNFGSGTAAWTLDTINGAKGNLKSEMGVDGKTSAHIEVPEAAAVPYYIQLFQSKLSVKAASTYHLTFRAKAKSEITIGVNMMIAETPWTTLWKQDVKLTTDWQTFSFDVTPSANADNARVTFSRLGAQPADYWFTDVSLAE